MILEKIPRKKSLGCSIFFATILGASTGSAISQTAPAAVAATRAIGGEQYVQLHVELTIDPPSPSIDLNDCPKDNETWKLDTGSLITGDREATIGVTIVSPDGSSQWISPVDLVVKHGFFNYGCSIKIDHIDYRSPLWYVRTSRDQQFHVTGVATVSKTIDPTTLAQVSSFLATVAPLAGVPGPAVTAGIAAAKSIPVGYSTYNAAGVYFTIGMAPAAAQTWSVNEILPENGHSVKIKAELVPVDTVIPAPYGGWVAGSTSGDVFKASFPAKGNTPGGPAQTIGSYVTNYASAELLSFTGAMTVPTATLACTTLRKKLDNISLTDADEALVLWALIKNHGPIADAHNADLIAPCMQGLENSLPNALLPPPAPPPAPPITSASAASVKQMKTLVEIGEAFWHFLVDAPWEDRSNSDGQQGLGDQLFGYPATVTDASNLWFGSKSLASTDSWGVYLPNKNQPILQQLGCYAYITNDGKNWVSKLGPNSIMLAIGVLPGGNGPNGKEVALLVSFAPAQAGGDTRIKDILVSDGLSPEAKAALITQFEAKGYCGSANKPFKPALLFGK